MNVERKSPERPDRPEYFMILAMAVRTRANCVGNRVGAVLIRDDRVIATGYNGTPQGMKNCDEGGCERCAQRERYRTSQGYDVCICVHAEQNALLSAARFGVGVEGAVMYTTMRPCFGCTKELIQARVKSVYYIHDWQHPEAELQKQYEILQARFEELKQLKVDDPDATWAVSSLREADTGHTMQVGE